MNISGEDGASEHYAWGRRSGERDYTHREMQFRGDWGLSNLEMTGLFRKRRCLAGFIFVDSSLYIVSILLLIVCHLMSIVRSSPSVRLLPNIRAFQGVLLAPMLGPVRPYKQV